MARDLRNILAYRIGTRAINDVAPLAHGRLLDIGCGDKQWAPMFAPYVTEHVGVDHPGSPHGAGRVDILADAYDIPVPDASFDTVLCTAVMEHLEEPAKALAEARRVLADGGTAIYTLPFIWHLHEEPRDFFRYSKYGIRHLFEEAGFEIERLQPLSGFWVTFGQMFSYYLYRLRDRGRLRRLRRPVIAVAVLLVQVIAGALDRADRAEEWTWMYLVVARARSGEAEPAAQAASG